MAKQRNFTPEVEEIIPNELLEDETVSDPETPTEVPEEPSGDVPTTEEPSVDGEKLDPAAAGCRAFGDTVLEFPALESKPFVDYRAEVVQHCYRNQPSVMELVEEDK